MKARLAPLLLLAACQKSAADPTPAPIATALAGSAPAPAASGVAPAAPAWFEGAWRGSFDAQLFRIELPVGGLKEWQQDDGKPASGKGTLELTVSRDGSAQGRAGGALGDLELTGQAEGDRLTLRLSSGTTRGFHGVLLATPSPEGMRGSLRASSGDSLQVRRADVTLSRVRP